MARVELDITTSLEAEQVIAALTDFTPQRPEIWPGLEPSLYEVYEVGPTSAYVREGNLAGPMKFWARERYDWSQPGTVNWRVEESNFCKPGSGVSAKVTPTDSGSSIHVAWERHPSNPFVWPLLMMIVATGGKPIRASVEPALRALERGEKARIRH